MEKFWMIYSEKGNPTKIHATYDDAASEATRLAIKSPGIKFYILMSIEVVETETPKVIKRAIL